MRPDEHNAASSLARARDAKHANLYRQLDGAQIVATGQTLARRIGERFPGSGLSAVAGDLVAVSRDAVALAAHMASPLVGWRLLSIGIAIVMVAIIAFVAVNLRVSLHVGDWVQLVQGLESLINDIVFAGIALLSACGRPNPEPAPREPASAGSAARRLLRQLGMREESEDAEAVVHRNRDHALARHRRSVVPRLVRRPRYKAAPIKVHQHGQLLSGGRCPHVQVQAVLVDAR